VTKQITKDLMAKVVDDVGSALRRVIAIAPDPHLPIAMAAGASVVAHVGILLDADPKPTPDPECIILAGLLIARTGLGGPDPIGAAYDDFEALKKAGRIPSAATNPQQNEER
jgi:hypothetical protein